MGRSRCPAEEGLRRQALSRLEMVMEKADLLQDDALVD